MPNPRPCEAGGYLCERRTLSVMSVVFTLLFVVIPIVELIIFTLISDIIGLGNTLLLVLVTAIIGATLVRWQGLSVFRRFRQQWIAGQIPASPLVHGMLVLVGGALLLTPGFLTDTVGFALMAPPVRELIYRSGRRVLRSRTIIVR